MTAAVEQPEDSDCPVRFTSASSDSTIPMLDMEIAVKSGRLSTSLHVKPTNRFQYVHPRSSHPTHTWHGVALGEFTRTSLLCSNPFQEKETRNFIRQRLLDRGFGTGVVNRALRTRSASATKRRRPVPLILTYHPALCHVPRQLRKLWREAGLAHVPAPFVAWRKGKPPKAYLNSN